MLDIKRYKFLLLPLALQPTAGFGLSKNALPFFPICYQLSPSSHSQHLKISFYFLFPSFPGSSLLLVPSSSWVKIFLAILSSSILSRWPNQLILCPFIHFTIFPPLLICSSSRFVRFFHSPFSYLGPYILLNIFLSKISRTCSSFFVNAHASAPHDTAGLISVLYNIMLVKATNAHSKYVTFITFPLQRWLRERSSMLRYTCIACLVEC